MQAICEHREKLLESTIFLLQAISDHILNRYFFIKCCEIIHYHSKFTLVF